MSDNNLTQFINYIKNTKNFMSTVDNASDTVVSQLIKDQVKDLEKIILTLDQSKDITSHQMYLATVNEQLNILLEAISEEFSATPGQGIRLSPDQAEIMYKVTEITILLQGYMAIMNDTNYIINTNYERLKKMELLRDLDITTLEQLYRNQDKDLKTSLTKSHTNTKFDDIKGIDQIKNNIFTNLLMTDELKFMENQDSYVFIVLCGPPGTGKTSIAHAIASEHSNGYYYNFDTAFLNAGIVGETEKQITRIFQDIKSSNSRITIIIDEIDNVLGMPENASFRAHMQTVKITLQTIIDDSGGLTRNVVIVGMTNYFNRIDPIIHRRITYRVYVPPPSEDDLFNYYEYLVWQGRNGLKLSDKYKNDFKGQLLNSECNGQKHVFTNANIKQIYKNASAEEYLNYFVLKPNNPNKYKSNMFKFSNQNETYFIIGQDRNMIDNVNNYTIEDQRLKSDQLKEHMQNNNLYIIPSIEALIKSKLVTNLMLQSEVDHFYQINNPASECNFYENQSKAVATL